MVRVLALVFLPWPPGIRSKCQTYPLQPSSQSSSGHALSLQSSHRDSLVPCLNFHVTSMGHSSLDPGSRGLPCFIFLIFCITAQYFPIYTFVYFLSFLSLKYRTTLDLLNQNFGCRTRRQYFSYSSPLCGEGEEPLPWGYSCLGAQGNRNRNVQGSLVWEHESK